MSSTLLITDILIVDNIHSSTHTYIRIYIYTHIPYNQMDLTANYSPLTTFVELGKNSKNLAAAKNIERAVFFTRQI